MGIIVQTSPGVAFREIDLTTIVPQVETSIGALAGPFRWGEMYTPTLVDSETTLVSLFGKPTNYNPETFFTASSYLAYSQNLLLVRTGNTTSTNGQIGVLSAIGNTGPVASVLACMVTKRDNFPSMDGSFNTNCIYVAKFPGTMGNSLRVSQCDTASQFSSTINIAASGVNGTIFTTNAGTNTATLAVNSTSITSANAAAVTLANSFSVGDLILVGNSSIGRYYQKVTAVQYDPVANATGNTIIGAANVTISFEGTFNSHTTYTSNTTLNRYWEFYNLIPTAPGQSDYVKGFGNTSANDELHVVVVDNGGMFSGVPGTVLEVYRGLSRATDGQAIDGGDNYYHSVLNHRSQYVWHTNDRQLAAAANSALVASATSTAPLNLIFNSGGDGNDETTQTLASVATGYDQFGAENVDIGLIMCGKSLGGTVGGGLFNYIIDNIASVRKDCVAFVSPNKDAVVFNPNAEADSVVTFRNTLRSTSYGFMDSGYKYMYDRYNDIYRWVPLNGDMAGLAALTEATNDAWWSPAGFNRGQIKNIVKLAWNPRKAFRDQLYKNGINPVVTFQNQGTVLFGDKTLLAKPSAFDRINVRRLFIVLEKAISIAAQFSLFEFNDEFTQAMFRNLVNPYLKDIKGRRGVTDFLVVCDSTNNTGQVVDSNQFVADIYIKPSRSINFITLNFIAVPTGIQFSEVIGRF